MPMEKETYLHRSGRAARFGARGWCISILFDGEESGHLDYFQAQLGFDMVDFHARHQVSCGEEGLEVGDEDRCLDRKDYVKKNLVHDDETWEGEEGEEDWNEEGWEEGEEEYYDGEEAEEED